VRSHKRRIKAPDNRYRLSLVRSRAEIQRAALTKPALWAPALIPAELQHREQEHQAEACRAENDRGQRQQDGRLQPAGPKSLKNIPRTIDLSKIRTIIPSVPLDEGRFHEAPTRWSRARRADNACRRCRASRACAQARRMERQGGAAGLASRRAPSQGARAARSQGLPKGGLANPLAPSRRSIPSLLWGRRKKGRRPTRGRKEYGRRSVGFSRQLGSGPAPCILENPPI
jgi:hypothetical protein